MLSVGLVLIITMVASEALAISTVMPLVERDLGQLELYGWVFSAFFLGNLVGISVAGRAADRVPLVVPFAVGIALFGVGLVVGGLAGSMPVLVGARVLQGLGAGALPATAYVVIGRAYPTELQPRVFALLATAWVLPSVVAPSVASVVGDHIGWRWVFLGLLPVLVPCTVIALVAVRSVAHPDFDIVHPTDTTLRDAVMLALGAGLLLGGLGATALAFGVGLAAGLAVGLPAFGRLVPEGTMRLARGLPATVACRGVLTFSFFAADAYVTLALVTGRGTSTLYAGVVVTVITVGWTAGSWIQARLVSRIGPRSLVTQGGVLVALGAVGYGVVGGSDLPVGFIMIGAAISGLGMGQAYSPLSVTVLSEAAPDQVGAATAGLHLADTLGVALGTGVGGVLVAAGDRAGWATSSSVLVVFLGAAMAALAVPLVARRIPSALRSADDGDQPDTADATPAPA
jgi:MFS family permease